MKSNNFENHIKKQLKDREISPSRDLWAAISQEMETTEVKRKTPYRWMAIAASVIFIIGIGSGLFLNSKETQNSDKTLANTKQEAVPSQLKNHPSTEDSGINGEPTQFEKLHPEAVETSSLSKSGIAELKKEQNTPASSAEIKNTIHPYTPEALKPKEGALKNGNIASNDTIQAKMPKKKRYTDANALLFSVEHKDAIHKTKDGSNVATIELEK